MIFLYFVHPWKEREDIGNNALLHITNWADTRREGAIKYHFISFLRRWRRRSLSLSRADIIIFVTLWNYFLLE